MLIGFADDTSLQTCLGGSDKSIDADTEFFVDHVLLELIAQMKKLCTTEMMGFQASGHKK